MNHAAIAPAFAIALTAGAVPSGSVAPSAPTVHLSARAQSPVSAVGLALRVWLVQDDPDAFARALGPFDEIRPESQAILDPRWRNNGLRLIAVPVREIERIEGEFRHVGPREVRSVSLGPRFTPLIEGIERDAVARIALDSGALSLEPGALRLIARAWPETVIRTDALGQPALNSLLRIEIVPQHVAQRPRRTDPQITIQPLLPVPRQGMLLSRLTAQLLVDGSHALIIVGEPPRTDWTPEQVGHEEPGPAEPQEPSIFGPPLPDSITLGESMLTADPYARNSPRIILVLVPQALR